MMPESILTIQILACTDEEFIEKSQLKFWLIMRQTIKMVKSTVLET